MSLKVVLYQHNKRINSTMLPPNGALKAEYEGVLIDGADVLHPSIAFRMAYPSSSPTVYNYAYIMTFSARYYFIDNWVYNNGRWVANMSVDVLASYKENIGNSEQYILRSANKKDPYITDMLYPTTRNISTNKTAVSLSASSLWSVGGNIKDGFYVIGIINNDSSAVGSVSYYLMNHSQIRKLLNVLMGGFNWLSIGDISEELTQALFNPFQYVVSCKWYPYNPQSGTTTDVSNLPYGWWTLDGVKALRYNGDVNVRHKEGEFTIPEHPDSEDDYFLNAAPYSECVGFFEPWGSFSIPCRAIRQKLYVYSNIDFVTGKGVLTIETAGGDVLAYKEAVLGVEIQLSQMSTNINGFLNDVTRSATSLGRSVQMGDFFGALNSITSGIANISEDLTPQLSSKGLNGSLLAFSMPPYIITRFARRVETDSDRLGFPLAQTHVIKTLGNYTLCANPSVTLTDAMPFEIESVNKHLAEGFYYE